jgi:predicted nucleic-acid-binding Zn-ribbon protein
LKKTLQCPKCDSRRLWHVERFSGHDRMQLALEYERSGTIGRGALELFACDACGYAELYAQTANLVEGDGVRLIDSAGPGGLR